MELKDLLATPSGNTLALIDVREEWEFAICQIDRSRNIPMAEVPEMLSSLDPASPTVLICHHGIRSAQVGDFLERNGFLDVINLAGGIDAWARDLDPQMATY